MENLVQPENFNKDFIIGFDIDDTLTDCVEYEYQKLQEYLTDVLHVAPYMREVRKVESTLAGRYPGLDDRFLHRFNDWYFPQMVKEAPFRAGVPELFDKLHNQGYTIYIITRRDEFYEKSKYTGAMMRQDTTERLQSEKINYDRIFFACDKKEKTMRENNVKDLVEDSPANIFQVSAKYPVIVMDNPTNSHIIGKNIYRIRNFNTDNFIKIISEIKNNG